MKTKTYKYEICISFAGEDRSTARKLASALKKRERSVFYDESEKLKLWGKDLFNHLYRIYSEESRFCVILFSENYLKKVWTNHELKAAQHSPAPSPREGNMFYQSSSIPVHFHQSFLTWLTLSSKTQQ